MIRTSLIILILFATLTSVCVFAAEPVVVDAEGTAIKSDAYDVRKQAIDDSLRKAVRVAVDAVVRQEGMKKAAAPAALADISANPAEYVLTYKILSEGWMTHFDISPQSVEEALGPANPNEAVPAGAALDAQSTGVEVYHIRVNASIDAKRLYAALVNLTGSSAAKPAETYIVTLADMADYNVYSAATSAIEQLPDIKDVNYGTFYRGRITFTAASSLSGQTLVERLAKELGAGFVVEMAADHNISIKPASAQPTQNEAQ